MDEGELLENPHFALKILQPLTPLQVVVPRSYQRLCHRRGYEERMLCFVPVEEIIEWTKTGRIDVVVIDVRTLMDYFDKDRFIDSEIKVSALQFKNSHDAMQFKLTFF